MSAKTTSASPNTSLLSFLAVVAGLATVALAWTVVPTYNPWLIVPASSLGLAVVAAGVAARTGWRWTHGATWALLAVAVVGVAVNL